MSGENFNGGMEEQILSECRKHLLEFSGMNDTEIYNWICDNFFCTDYNMMRVCSFAIFHECHHST